MRVIRGAPFFLLNSGTRPGAFFLIPVSLFLSNPIFCPFLPGPALREPRLCPCHSSVPNFH